MSGEEHKNGDITDGAVKGKGKKGKKGKVETNALVESGGSGTVGPSLTPEQMENLKKAMQLMNTQSTGGAVEKPPSEYKFWSTQPVPKLNEVITTNEEINPDPPLDKIRSEPYTLPDGFKWDTLLLDDPLVLKEVYVLLNENYVEDDDNMFRFDYSPEFINWALQPPGWHKEWHCGVRVAKSNKLVGFISAVPAHIRITAETQTEKIEKSKQMVEINFLCVHKKLRSKRLAPVLIKEITRRVNMKGVFQAVYTAGVVLPKPIGTCRYWHRSLNPKKLIEVKFSHLSRNMTMQRHLKLYRLPEQTKVNGLRIFEPKDIEAVTALLNDYLSKFSLSPVFSAPEVEHWFSPKPNIINSYVVEREGKITDFMSFYCLPSTVMNHPTHKNIKAAYSFYNVATSTSWVDLMSDALILAKKDDFDVFNALDLMENLEFLEKLKFGIGDGNLQYYFYNWRCPDMVPTKIGLVLQ